MYDWPDLSFGLISLSWKWYPPCHLKGILTELNSEILHFTHDLLDVTCLLKEPANKLGIDGLALWPANIIFSS